MILLVSTCAEELHEKEFVKPYKDFLHEGRVVHYKDLGGEDIEAADAAIICGTGLADNAYVEELDAFSWVRDVDIPLMGVCSGAQVVAASFGGEMVADELIGMVEVEGDLFGREGFRAYTLHRNGFTVPEEFDIMARSGESVQAVRHRERPVYGVSFHPEVRNTWVLEEFVGEEVPI